MRIRVEVEYIKKWFDEDTCETVCKEAFIDIEDSDILKLGDRYKELAKKRAILEE